MILKIFVEDQDIMVAVLPFTTIRNSLHTCATVRQSCFTLDADSCLPFRVSTFQLTSLITQSKMTSATTHSS